MAKKKKSKKVSFHELNDGELSKTYNDAKKRLQELRFSIVTGTVKNIKEINRLKRDIARVQTVRRAKEISAQKGMDKV